MSNGASLSARVRQAQGMVSVQAACSMDDALAMMRDRATVSLHTLDEIASLVIDLKIRFGE